MTGEILEIVPALILAPPVAALAILFHGPSGYLGAMAGRQRRASWRNRRTMIRRRKVPRGRQRSQRVSKRMRRIVLTADRNRCAYCRVTARQLALTGEKLQVDHIVPWSWGGLTCLWNCAALCPRDNRHKSAYWVDEHGRTRGNGGSWGASPAEGRKIYKREVRQRLSPGRCLRGLAAILT